MTRHLSLAFVLLLASGPARAAGSDLAKVVLGDPGFRGAMITGGLGWNKIDEDYFVAVSAGTIIDLRAFRLGLHVPLNLRVIDRDPKQSGTVRREDWDEVSDWFRVLRFVEAGHPRRGPFYLRYGELVAVSLGHGTVIDSYYNSIDPDHYQGGLRVRLDLGPAGGELILDNIPRTTSTPRASSRGSWASTWRRPSWTAASSTSPRTPT